MSKTRDIIPSYERNEYTNQLEVIADEQKIRNNIGKNKPIIGYAEKGFFNILDETNFQEETWYNIGDSQWIAFNEDAMKFLKAKDETEIIIEVDNNAINIQAPIPELELELLEGNIEEITPMVGDKIIVRGRVYGSAIGTAPIISLKNEKVIIREIQNLKKQSPYAINSMNGNFIGWIEEKSIKSIERGNE